MTMMTIKPQDYKRLLDAVQPPEQPDTWLSRPEFQREENKTKEQVRNLCDKHKGKTPTLVSDDGLMLNWSEFNRTRQQYRFYVKSN